MNANQRMKKLKKNNSFIVLAHRDMPELTYRNLDLPDIVPVYLNFDLANRVGRAWLQRKENDIYAVVTLDLGINGYGERPQVLLGVEDGTTVIENEIRYIDNGVVTAAGIVKEKDWKDIYGEQVV